MPLIVMMLVVTLVSQCCSAPQWRNWTRQAILYLKGTPGHRSVLERNSREEADSLHSVHHKRGSNRLGMSLDSSSHLQLLQRAADEGGNHPGYHADEQQQNLNYL